MFEELQVYVAYLLTTISLENGIASAQPLALFVVGMVFYSVFIFKFYRFVAGRDVFKQPPDDYPAWKKFLHIMQFVFFYPLLAFFWFLVISLLLASLSETITIGNIFLASMATIATIRVTAYYNEDLSKDIAKLVPFGLLAVMLLDITKLSVDTPLSVLYQISTVADTLLYYFIFVVLLEFTLRVITWPIRHKKFVFKNWETKDIKS